MGVWRFLSSLVDAAALVLDEGLALAEFAIVADRYDGDVAPAVVGDQQVLALAVSDEVAGAAARRADTIDLGEFS